LNDFYHYLPVNDAAMRWGIYVTGAGRAAIAPGEPYPSQGHPEIYDFHWQRGRVLPEFQVILITRGRGLFESEKTDRQAIEPGSLIFLFPGVWHRYRPDESTGWHERWLSVNGELTHRLLELHVLRPELPVRKARGPRSVAKSFDRLLDRIHADPNQNSILLSLHAMELLADALESAALDERLEPGRHTVRGQGIRDPIVAEALDLIWTHSHRPFSVQRIVDRVSVSRSSLERHFHREVGHTILDEINACRLNRAKRLLRETELGVQAIATLAGFSSDERMRVNFLQAEGVAPSEYRRRAGGRRSAKRARPKR
jgi:AraC-like DNA-binding protein